jgi:hypothetical protein
MPTDAPSPLRLFDPEAEPYETWAEHMAQLREKLRELWKVNRVPRPAPWNGNERRKQAR